MPDNFFEQTVLLFLLGNLSSDQVSVDHLALLDWDAAPGTGDRNGAWKTYHLITRRGFQ